MTLRVVLEDFLGGGSRAGGFVWGINRANEGRMK